jgi:hypothetical protein
MVDDWLVTVMLSCSVATSSFPLTVAAAPAPRLTSETLSVANPDSAKSRCSDHQAAA